MTANQENTLSNTERDQLTSGNKAEPSVDILDLSDMQATQASDIQNTLPVLNSINPLSLVKTKLRVVVGELEISIGELMSAKEHQVFPLSTKLDQPVDLVLEGHTIARGQLVAIDGHFAIRISELPIPLQV
ncbi:FliM/FliN family flagellar motor switch protein [Undibacterium flavidum]|uniref:FliM/FliN family flagellar motor switch protein n=1 Tax=Undibacterium flavidum TaxID=2762297 RepID=A0ABR6YET7_9BURK|nr:FliM/FliN family flagellar motor switch protein [Undibacterium flavidum]MBC3875053.1 FliM/FliN family flagellar motor switch protein [Undibacterium flavidum]